MFGRGSGRPMRRRHILYPPHPHRIVDMAKLVDVGGGWGEVLGEGFNAAPQSRCAASQEKRCESACVALA